MSLEIGGLGSSNNDKRSYRQKFVKLYYFKNLRKCSNHYLSQCEIITWKEDWLNTEYYEIISLPIDFI